MAISIKKMDGAFFRGFNDKSCLYEYEVDSQSDIGLLPTDLTTHSPGSIAKVIDDGTIWKLNNSGVWVKQPDQAADLASLKAYILPVQLQINQGTGTTLAVMLNSLAGVDLSDQQNYLINGDPLDQFAVILITCTGGTFTVSGATSTGTAGYYRVNGGEPLVVTSI